MDYHRRSSISPPPTPKVKHHHRRSLTSCFRFASCDGGERVESPRHSRTFHPKVHFCFSGGKHRRRLSSEFSHSSRPQALSPRDGFDGFDDRSRIHGNVEKDAPLRFS